MAAIAETPIEGPAVWTAEKATPEDGLVRLDATALAEIEAVATDLEHNPLPTEALRPSDYPMAQCEAVMDRVRVQLDDGVGFAIIDRLPLDRLSTETAKQIYWLLISHLGQTVAQKWNGLMVYDVTDTGQEDIAGSGVRSSKTSDGQYFHTDNSFNLPPEFVALLCLQKSRTGGESGVVSFQTAYNILLKENPDAVARLSQPFHFDRQHEHAPGDEALSSSPVFKRTDNGVQVQFSRRLIQHGYKLAEGGMDAHTQAAVRALCDIMERPNMARSFMFEPGQIQIVNNRTMGHRRTAFEDWPEAERKRHLVRLWVRRQGRPTYFG
ncbi:MAG: TauD/TfdA family dioxygenase [Rhodospirillaceae bacterium]|jgi:alpha-ketoglutarate-dependent taurine dioxygenase|nr:TauD/TfdA family dioxygenase [Rhodospirillaceae bacterium]